jgi:hypothetical protein
MGDTPFSEYPSGGYYPGSSPSLGPGDSANLGLFQIPISASFLNPSATATQTFNPTVNQNVTQSSPFDFNLNFSQIGAPRNSASASLFGGGGGDGGPAGYNSANINYAPSVSLSQNLPNPPGFASMPNILQGGVSQNVVTRPNMMPTMMGGGGNPPMIGQIAPPIAAGGYLPMMPYPMNQQQQYGNVQQITPGMPPPASNGSAQQAGGYPSVPMGMSANPLTGAPNIPQSFGQPRMAPSAPQGSIATPGGAVPANQVTANAANGLVPPPPPYTPSMLSDSPPGRDGGEPAAADRGMPMDTDAMEQDALARSEASTREGVAAVQKYYEKKAAKEAKRESDKALELSNPEEPTGPRDVLKRRIKEKAHLEYLKKLQDTKEGRQRILNQAHEDAITAVQNWRSSVDPVPMVKPAQSYYNREPLIKIGHSNAWDARPDPIAQRQRDTEANELYRGVYGSRLSYYTRDLKNDMDEADKNIEAARKAVNDIESKYDKRTDREERSALRELNADLNKAKLNQGTAALESTVAARKEKAPLIHAQTERTKESTKESKDLLPGKKALQAEGITKGTQAIETGKAKQELRLPGNFPVPAPGTDKEDFKQLLKRWVDTKKITAEQGVDIYYQVKGSKRLKE